MLSVPLEFTFASNYLDALWRASAEWGIEQEYFDIFGKRHQIPSDKAAQLLEALGVDVTSHETIDFHRLRRFERERTTALPHTLVISASELAVPLTLGDGPIASLTFSLQLENGLRIPGSIDLNKLSILGTVSKQDTRLITYKLPLPAETPLGYHRLSVAASGNEIGQTQLIVCPDRAYLPEKLAAGGKTAGLNVTLYGLRSARNWGCGDFTDLQSLAEWSARNLGVSFIGLNPLHALHNRAPYNTSPYLPLSMFYKNLIYLDIERAPEFNCSAWAKRLRASPAIEQCLAKLREAEFVEYEKVNRIKRSFLKLLFRMFRQSAQAERTQRFDEYCATEGDLLHRFATYCALDEILHKQDRNRWTWRDWPEEYRSPDTQATRSFAAEHDRTVSFYKYVQFVIEEQLSEAQRFIKQTGMDIGLYHDLALATDSCGSDLWANPSFYVEGCRVGAPPDDFSPKGQDWAFPPPRADAHRDNGYELFRESIRKIVSHGGALRIDHVMRLFRLFWIPAGAEAADGTYVLDNATDLLRVLALESVRSENIIIGEDLGTVTDQMRNALSRFGILSYRLFYFEKRSDGRFKGSNEYPRQALVASATHDLPTAAGFWKGRDIEARKAAGLADERAGKEQFANRAQEKQYMLEQLHQEHLLPAGYPRNATEIPDVDGPLHNAILGFLAQVPSLLLLINQEDLTKETEQQNLPGSTAEYPNWSRKMRFSIDELSSERVAPYAAMLRDQLQRTERC